MSLYCGPPPTSLSSKPSNLWTATSVLLDGQSVNWVPDPTTCCATSTQSRSTNFRNSITNGTIDRLELTYEILESDTVGDLQANKQAYTNWLIETYANESDQLVGGSIGEISITPDNRLRHRELVVEWAAQQ